MCKSEMWLWKTGPTSASSHSAPCRNNWIMQTIEVMVPWTYKSFITVFICLHSFSLYSTCCYTNSAQSCFYLYIDLRHEIEKCFGKPGSFTCLWNWKEHIKTVLIPPSTSASLWYLCGILYRFSSQGHHFVLSGLDLENMGLAMDSIQESIVPGVWVCLSVMSLCRKSMDLVTRVSWSHKSHCHHCIHKTSPKSTWDSLFISVQELRLPCGASKPKNTDV